MIIILVTLQEVIWTWGTQERGNGFRLLLFALAFLQIYLKGDFLATWPTLCVCFRMNTQLFDLAAYMISAQGINLIFPP